MSRRAKPHRKSANSGNGSARNWRRSMSAEKRTSLDAVFGIEEPVVTPLKKHRGKNKPEPSSAAKMSAAETARAGDSKRPNVKQHTAYLPLAVHEQIGRAHV